MKIFIILSALLVADIIYLRVTRITYHNYKAKISSIYTRFFTLRELPVKPVILIPGIKASDLEDASGHKLWLSLKSLLSNQEALKYTEGDGVKASGIFNGFNFIPFILDYRPHFDMVANLASAPNSYFFYYDWRDYPDNNARKFGELVDRVISETGQKPSVVAHSMGGLIVHGYLKEHPGKLDRIVYTSVPFKPGIGYFDDVNVGSQVALDSTILSPEATWSHPASFLLLAHRGSNNYFGKELMDAKTWSDNRWSIFKDSQIDPQGFQQMIDRVGEYHKLLDTPMRLENRFLFIVSNSYPTDYKIDAAGKRVQARGDDRVNIETAYPVDEMPHSETAIFPARHGNQMNYRPITKKVLEFLSRA